MRPPFSLIVVFHSGSSYLQACLESILSTARVDDEIIVVANNADPRQLELPTMSDRVHIIKHGKALGYAGASNAGAELARHKYLVFCDHDLVFQPKWLDYLWASYTAAPEIGACSCMAINPHSSAVLDFGIAFSAFNGAHPGMDLPVIHKSVQADRFAQAVCTSGFLISATDFKLAGGFDLSFGSMYTDLDLCLQLKRMGRKIVASAKARAYHFGGDFHLAGDKAYKSNFLKADIKGAFFRKHADILESDLGNYYAASALQFIAEHGPLQKYMCCNMMNVADPQWYEDQLHAAGMTGYESLRIPTRQRDASTVGLFEHLGFELMRTNARLAYFVDRFVCLRGNEYWWERRAGKGDIVVDRNANIMPVGEAMLGER